MSVSDVDSTFFFMLLPRAALSPALASAAAILAAVWLFPGGVAWALSRGRRSAIPGPPGVVRALSGTLAHRTLSKLSRSLSASRLMAFSVGTTRFVISSNPETAKDILNSSAFADRPIKESAYELLFHRAMGFAPFGDYWRNLRRISATYLFSPKRISAFGGQRADIGLSMVNEVSSSMERKGAVELRRVLHLGSLNNVMSSVFGKRYDFGKGKEAAELEGLVKEGYDLLGVFNWSDHLPLVGWLDLQGVRRRCRRLVHKVNVFVAGIINEHRMARAGAAGLTVADFAASEADFVDVLLDLQGEEKLSDSDMVAVLWEMIFRGTDTVAILLEWIMARMVVHPEIQSKAQAEIDAVSGGGRKITAGDIQSLPYIQAIVKETLRMHPPGPLLSWARLAIHDAHVGEHMVPAGTTAMVNMWAIAHDESVWPEAEKFNPERFIAEEVSVLGSDLRLAPFGSGRRVCPGKTMALATVHLWLAQLLQSFEWVPSANGAVDLSESLNMSLEMKNPLLCAAVSRVSSSDAV